jgi:hypothetical protein
MPPPLQRPSEPFESDAPPATRAERDPAPSPLERATFARDLAEVFASDLWRSLMADPTLETAVRGLARGRELGLTWEDLRDLSQRFHCAAGAMLEACAVLEDDLPEGT